MNATVKLLNSLGISRDDKPIGGKRPIYISRQYAFDDEAVCLAALPAATPATVKLKKPMLYVEVWTGGDPAVNVRHALLTMIDELETSEHGRLIAPHVSVPSAAREFISSL